MTGRKVDTSFIQDTLGFYEPWRRPATTCTRRVLKLATEPGGVDAARLLELVRGRAGRAV